MGTSTLRIPALGSSSDWVLETDVGGRYSCSVRGDIGSTGVAARVEDSMRGRVSAREDGDEMEVVVIDSFGFSVGLGVVGGGQGEVIV